METTDRYNPAQFHQRAMQACLQAAANETIQGNALSAYRLLEQAEEHAEWLKNHSRGN